jgi:4-amino-4-deoxy-L-arabinose transferase-like glycosyltransferase
MIPFFNKVSENRTYSLAFLFGLSLFFFAGLGNVHLFDWDEINFAESAREMIESNNYLRVQINYNPFWEKPPFFFWLQVGAMKLFGINEFASRFPNALFGFIYLSTFYLIGKKHFSGKFGLIWALLFFASLLPHIYFKSGIIDPVFNYFIFLSIYFMLLVIGKIEKHILLFSILSGIFSGMSVITKGPVGFLLLGLTLLVYLIIYRFKKFPSIKSILVFFSGFLIIISAWLAMEVYQNGWKILIQFIEYQIELFNSPVAGHEQPFYYHFLVVLIGCFPISIFALPQFLRSKNESPYDIRVWMLSLFWVVLILFSLSTTKIIHYSSMTYIPLSFLAAITIYSAVLNQKEISRSIKNGYLILGITLGLAILLLPIVIYNKELLYPYMNDPFAVASLKHAVQWSGFEFIGGLILMIGVFISYRLFVKSNVIGGILTISGSMGITLLFVLYFILPKIEDFTQGPAISFYKSKRNEKCYIESYGFKSYAQYFYSNVQYGLNDQRKIHDWLLNGEIDKTVYYVSKITNNELDSHPNFKKIKTEGGFNFYVRKVK